MPYPNEHACRINEPEKYEKVRRQNGSGDKPDMIFGIKDGKSEVQAFRFSIDRFTEAQARAFCEKEGGKFEPAEETMKEEVETEIKIQEDATVEPEEVTDDMIDKGVLPVRIVTPGFNHGKNHFYAESAIASTPVALEGCKMFANHQEKDKGAVRDIRDWVASLKDVRVSGKKNSVGNAHIHAPWFKDFVKGLKAQGNLSQLGISINTYGVGTPEVIEGIRTLNIKEIKPNILGSVDFVTYPGAGGQAGLVEDVSNNSEKIGGSNMELEEKVIALEGQISTLTEQVTSLVKERDETKIKLEEAERLGRVSNALIVLKEQIDKADVPLVVKERILKQFEGAETTEGLAEAIASEKDYIAKITESGKPKDMGKTTVNPDDAKKRLQESFMKFGMSEKEAEIAAKGK